MVNGQALFVTEQGRFGLGQPNAEAGYEVWAVGGSQWPLLLKPRQGQGLETQDSAVPGRWMFCSECFVFGIMKGEAVEGREKKTKNKQQKKTKNSQDFYCLPPFTRHVG